MIVFCGDIEAIDAVIIEGAFAWWLAGRPQRVSTLGLYLVISGHAFRVSGKPRWGSSDPVSGTDCLVRNSSHVICYCNGSSTVVGHLLTAQDGAKRQLWSNGLVLLPRLLSREGGVSRLLVIVITGWEKDCDKWLSSSWGVEFLLFPIDVLTLSLSPTLRRFFHWFLYWSHHRTVCCWSDVVLWSRRRKSFSRVGKKNSLRLP